MKRSVLFLVVVATAGCASKPEKIAANYVSPTRYAELSCSQLDEEFREVQSRVNAMTKQQRKDAKNDKIATGIGLVVFWPALFFLLDDDQKEELAQLKGEYEAIQETHKRKNCLDTEFSSDVADDASSKDKMEPIAEKVADETPEVETAAPEPLVMEPVDSKAADSTE